MKLYFVAILLIIPFLNYGQSPERKKSKDSIAYYRTELNKLWQSTMDSLKNSEKYKELQSKSHQNNRNSNKNVRVELLANLGIYFTDFKNLNARLKSIGQQEIKSLTPSGGASLAIGFPIMTYGFEFSGYLFDNKTASFKGVHGRVYIGTNLFKRSIIVLNPQIGYAGSYLNMFIRNSANPGNFNDLFNTQANTIQLSHSQDYLDFALGIKLHIRKSENFYWQFFRAGYRYGLKEKAWEMRGGKLNNAPLDRNNQFYLQLCMGFDR